MANGLPVIQVPPGTNIRVAVLVRSPDVMSLLFPDILPESVLETGRVDERNYGHFRQMHAHERGILERLYQVIKSRWPEAEVYTLDRLGAGPAKKWGEA